MTNNRGERRRAEIEANRAARRLMKAISRGLAGMQPPENLTVTEWAECKRYLSTEASAEPGLWRTSRTPYLRAIMDAFTDPKKYAERVRERMDWQAEHEGVDDDE